MHDLHVCYHGKDTSWIGSTAFVYTMNDKLMREPYEPTSKEIDDYMNTQRYKKELENFKLQV